MNIRTLAATVAFLQIGAVALPTAQAFADDDHRHGHKEWRGDDHQERAHDRADYRANDRRNWDRPHDDDERDHDGGRRALPFYHGPAYVVPDDRIRYFRGVPVVRPYGHRYSGYGHFESDDDAMPFLAFAAISLAVLDLMNQHQQRALEDAQIRAAEAPIGDPIHWNNGNAGGTVTALRDGQDSQGRYCREFQQKVKIGGKISSAYGTACRQIDGTWQIVSTH